MAMITKEVHISEIEHGDTIIHRRDGLVYTVDRNNIKKGGFLGTSLYGDSYNSGTVLVTKVLVYDENDQDRFITDVLQGY